MLSKESVMPLLRYRGKNTVTNHDFLLDLTNAIVTSGLSMIIAGNTRVSSGAEHLISHAIDEYFPDKSTIHGLQVGWAHLIIEKKYRGETSMFNELYEFYESIGVNEVLSECIPWKEDEFEDFIPYAKVVRNRYTIFDVVDSVS